MRNASLADEDSEHAHECEQDGFVVGADKFRKGLAKMNRGFF